MIAWLQANWLVLLLGVGHLWLFTRRGGCCGMGGHSHNSSAEHDERSVLGEGQKREPSREGIAEGDRDAVHERPLRF
jgi:hypothetical protein